MAEVIFSIGVCINLPVLSKKPEGFVFLSEILLFMQLFLTLWSVTSEGLKYSFSEKTYWKWRMRCDGQKKERDAMRTAVIA